MTNEEMPYSFVGKIERPCCQRLKFGEKRKGCTFILYVRILFLSCYNPFGLFVLIFSPQVNSISRSHNLYSKYYN